MEIDYKEKYELAIERLKQWDREHPDGYAISERDEFIFPELKKSEDERIREYLITYFSDIDDCASSLKGKDVVAWLEKQKHEEWSLFDEKILSEVFVSVETDNAYSEGKKKEIISWLQKYRPYMHEKKGLDNPAWSEEDEINLEKAIWYVENPAPMVVKDSMLVEWLKSLRPRSQVEAE